MAMTFRSLLRQTLPCCTGEVDLEEKLSNLSLQERIERINKKKESIEKAVDIDMRTFYKLEAEIESLSSMFIGELLSNSAEELVEWANNWHRNQPQRSHSESDLNKAKQHFQQTQKIPRVNSVPKHMGSLRMKQASTEKKPKKGLKAVWKRLSDKFTRTKPVKEQYAEFSCMQYLPLGNVCDNTGIYDEFGEEVLYSMDDLPFRRRRMEKNKKVEYDFDHTGNPIAVAPTLDLLDGHGFMDAVSINSDIVCDSESIFYAPITVETEADINPYLCPESDIIDLPDLDDDECETDLRAKHDSVTKEIETPRKALVVTMNSFGIRVFSQEEYDAACEAVAKSQRESFGLLSGSVEDLTEDEINMDWTRVFSSR